MSQKNSSQLPEEDSRMIALMKDNETKTLYELAEHFGVPPASIEKRFREAAENLKCFDYFLRSTLLRQMFYYVPTGFRMHGDWKLIRSLSSWVGMVGNTKEIEALCQQVGDRIQADTTVADDWLPQNADDPSLIAFFKS